MFDRSDGVSLRSGFLWHAKACPEAPAFVIRGVPRSYGSLEDTARRWAGAIVEAKGSRPERVALFAYRSDVAYCGTMAALFAGAAFVPLNPTFPAEKNAFMLRQADCDAIIVDKACAPLLAGVLVGAKVPPVLMPEFDTPEIPGVNARILDRAELERAPPLEQLPPVTPEDVAYILFTSGSTGTPKGVPVTHRNVVYFIDAMTAHYAISADDRFSQSFDQTFDLAVFDLFMSWSNGASVYSMSPVELLAPTPFVNRNELTIWFSVPSVAARMMRRNTLSQNSMPTLRWSLFCGEPLPRVAAETWQEAARNSVVENLYGPTELTIACFSHRWDPELSPRLCRNDLVPIGRPFPGLTAMVLSDTLEPVPAGEAGELCVSGPQTTPGYWLDGAKTAERFVELPVSRHEVRRFYRTGDQVLRLPEGEYVFLGRMDDQIKVFGHRVELGEIEGALRDHEGVEHAVAFGWPVVAGSAQGIVAFVSGENLDSARLTAIAKLKLPPYAVPGTIHIVDEMPLNANGKVDRRSLRDRLATADKSVKE